MSTADPVLILRGLKQLSVPRLHPRDPNFTSQDMAQAWVLFKSFLGGSELKIANLPYKEYFSVRSISSHLISTMKQWSSGTCMF